MLKGPFNVSFDLQGGTGEAPSFQVFEGEIPMPKTDDPTKAHYEFLGYGLEKTTKEEDLISKYFDVVDKDVAIYAQWEQVDFKVSFNGNDGLGEMDDMWVEKDKETGEGTLTFPEGTAFSKLHYKFIGWTTEETGEQIFKPNDTLIISKDIEVKAVWELADCVVHYICGYSDITWEEFTVFVPLYGEGLVSNIPNTWTYQNKKYRYVGWKDSAGKKYFAGDKISPNGKSEIILTLFMYKIRYFEPIGRQYGWSNKYIFAEGNGLRGTPAPGLTTIYGHIRKPLGDGYDDVEEKNVRVFTLRGFSNNEIIEWNLGGRIALLDDENLNLKSWYTIDQTGSLSNKVPTFSEGGLSMIKFEEFSKGAYIPSSYVCPIMAQPYQRYTYPPYVWPLSADSGSFSRIDVEYIPANKIVYPREHSHDDTLRTSNGCFFGTANTGLPIYQEIFPYGG